jgi:hypothetical protein
MASNFQPSTFNQLESRNTLLLASTFSTFNLQLSTNSEPETRNSKPSTRLTDICNNLQRRFRRLPDYQFKKFFGRLLALPELGNPA